MGKRTPETRRGSWRCFTGRWAYPVVGHNLPQEAPADFAAAVLELL
jgi:pimeloyl-ACP methyl ester carboxylesterase